MTSKLNLNQTHNLNYLNEEGNSAYFNFFKSMLAKTICDFVYIVKCYLNYSCQIYLK